MSNFEPTLVFRPLHLGVAVRDIGASLAFYEQAFGWRCVKGPVVDPIQQVTVCFLSNGGGVDIELIEPNGDHSPVARYLAREVGAYHICYEVPNIHQTVRDMESKGCLIVSPPVSAVAFEGRQIAWIFTPTRQLIEFLQADTSGTT